jgi:ribonuclease HII
MIAMTLPRHPKFFAGLDENGLGPLLGPLVTTAVYGVSADAAGKAKALGPPGKRMTKVLGDSKTMVRFGDSMLGADWARAIGAAEVRAGAQVEPLLPTSLQPKPMHNGVKNTVQDARVLDSLLLDAPAMMKRRCPPGHETQCWGERPIEVALEEQSSNDDHEATLASKRGQAKASVSAAVSTVAKDIAKTLAKLQAQGVTLLGARVVVTCTNELNQLQDAGVSRLHANLRAMERLILHGVELAAERRIDDELLAPLPGDVVRKLEPEFVCGKVGGLMRYEPAFFHLAPHLKTVMGEVRQESAYHIQNVGLVRFLQDAEDQVLLIALASLIGKWVRDTWMERIAAFHGMREQAATGHVLPLVSGYHDPKTLAFVEATAATRRKHEFLDVCFARTAAPKAG